MPSVTRTPLCTVKYCPAPRDPDWHHCLVTGSNVIEHHHVEGRGIRTLDKKKVVPLAVPIHNKISLNEYGDAILDLDGSKLYRIWDLKNETIYEGVHAWMQPVLSAAAEGGVGESILGGHQKKRAQVDKASVASSSAAAPSAGQSKEESDGETRGVLNAEGASHRDRGAPNQRRKHQDTAAADGVTDEGRPSLHRAEDGQAGPLTHEQRVATLAEDWKTLSDDELQDLYETAEKKQGLSFLVKCKAVHSFKEKHDWGDAWTEHAYQRFGASRRTLYAYANIWAICVTSDTFIERVAPLTDSKSLMQAIGRRSLEDGVVAMEAAVAHYAEFGEAPTVAALAHTLGVEAKERPRHECPDCGADHQVKS
jgi:hypothetical protein